MIYKKNDYALNKYSDDIVYRSVTGELTKISYKDMKMENPGMTPNDFKNLKEFSDDDYHVSCNTENNQVRRQLPLDILECSEGYAAESPEGKMISKELKAKINAAIESLTETQQRRVRLYYFDGLTTREIALIEKRNQKSIVESIHAATEKLKNILSDTPSKPSLK